MLAAGSRRCPSLDPPQGCDLRHTKSAQLLEKRARNSPISAMSKMGVDRVTMARRCGPAFCWPCARLVAAEDRRLQSHEGCPKTARGARKPMLGAVRTPPATFETLRLIPIPASTVIPVILPPRCAKPVTRPSAIASAIDPTMDGGSGLSKIPHHARRKRKDCVQFCPDHFSGQSGVSLGSTLAGVPGHH